MTLPAYAAVYGGDTFVFGRGDEVPGEYGGKTLNESYRDIETEEYRDTNGTTPWTKYAGSITSVLFNEIIKPICISNWFYGFSKLTSIVNIDKLDTSNVSNMNNMFYGCSMLSSVDVSNFDTNNVIFMNKMFKGCSSLTSLDLSSFNVSNVALLTDLFNGCKSLTNIDLSSFDTSNSNSMMNMFNGCSSLTSLDLSSFDTSKVVNMKNMFSGCSEIVTIYVSPLWTNGKASYSSDMFLSCEKIVGGDGTVYDASHTDAIYARIDNPPDAPGYFTEKAA